MTASNTTTPNIDYAEIDLGGAFALDTPARPAISTTITLPGDVHTALIEAGEIPDPYFGDNEQAVMWVSEVPWNVERRFEVSAEMAAGLLTLTLSEIDCIAAIKLNGKLLARVDNQFIRHDFDVTGKIRPGENTLRIEFGVARDIAKKRYDAHPFPIPYAEMNQPYMAHINFLRKTACHGGWDWGICLMPVGVYGAMKLRRTALARTDSVQISQKHTKGRCDLTITTRVHAFAAGTVNLSHNIAGQDIGGKSKVIPGENTFTHKVRIDNPDLWWPAGQGAQNLYTLTTGLDGEFTKREIGFRDLEWIVEKDAIDHAFKCRVNGRDITMLGANWIPADAIPSRITKEVVRDLLESAVAANMNMIRVWGGGQYEPDYFYEICDELGILVWHDFMFSCMSYPTNPEMLDSIRTEITQQVRRLNHHASIALWCGDNEVIGSINWFEETRNNRDRFVANYDRLSNMLASIVAEEDPGRRFWPSSPSLGYMDFADGWHIDTRGDMHYWDVWHSAKPFEAYRTVNPRFASEFGFQSFTSMNVIESFTSPEDRNPSSPVMETHQRNEGGNARILETMCRYFRFPKGFAEMVFLSQVQQGLAIKTAIEYWRSTKPRCMGTLFWQINDCWPVASWASLDYGGQWKLLHYMARRFFLPQNVVAIPDTVKNAIVLRGINDSAGKAEINLTVSAVHTNGSQRPLHQGQHSLNPDKAIDLLRLPLADLAAGEFLFFEWTDKNGVLLGENDFFPRAYKYYEIEAARIKATWSSPGGRPVLTLTTDKPAFFVTATTDMPGYFSDNAVTLLPGRETRLSFTPRNGAKPNQAALAKGLKLQHLRETF